MLAAGYIPSKMKRLYYIILLAVQAATAQQVLTLQQCLESGLKSTPDFQLKQLDILSAEITHRSPVLEYLPSVSFNGTHTYNIGSVIDPATNNRVSSRIQSDNFSLNASMNLLDFNVFTTARRNKIAALKTRRDKEATEAEYALTLLDNYITVLYTQELLKIQVSQFENAKFNLDRITQEVDLGSRPKSDLYDMQVSYSQEESTILQTRQLLYNQKLQLLQLMNDTAYSPDDIVLDGINTTALLEQGGVNEMLEKALGVAPAVRAAELNIEVAKKNVAIERNNYLPVLSAFYSYSSFYYLPLNQPGNGGVNPFFSQLNDNKNHYMGLQLSIPIFNGLKTSQKVQLAKIEKQKGEVLLEQEKIKLRQGIEQEAAKKEQNTILAAMLEESRGYAEKSFATTQAKFTSGLVDAITFTASKNQLLTAEYNLLKANITAAYSGIKLHFLQFNSFE